MSAQRLNWVMIYYVFVVHVGFLGGLKAALLDAKWPTLAFSLVLAYLSGLGITSGAHRLWAHRSFRAHGSVRLFLMLCNSLANQGTIFQWCRDHHVHRKFVDTPADPHDSTRGFFYSHMGWMFYRKDPRVVEAGKKLNFGDLLVDWTARIQYQLSPWGNLIVCFVAAPVLTMYVTGETAWTALLVAGFLRFVVVLHGTLLVNSAAHVFGYQPRALNNSPVENWLLATFAIGEQFHL